MCLVKRYEVDGTYLLPEFMTAVAILRARGLVDVVRDRGGDPA
jgi:hypothetical protein